MFCVSRSFVFQSVQSEAMDIYEIKKLFGQQITFWGGIRSQIAQLLGHKCEQHATQRVAKRKTKTAFKRLRHDRGDTTGIVARFDLKLVRLD